MDAQERFGLRTLGRATVDGVAWVVYSDEVFRHVVEAEDYDADDVDERFPRTDDEDDADQYTYWCMDARFADDDTALRVARQCDVTHVHSATDGVCGVIAVDA